MDLSPESIKTVRGDRILVKVASRPDKIGSFYVPENAKTARNKKRSAAWRAIVTGFGEEVDGGRWSPATLDVGETIFVAPEAVDCPSFTDGDEKYIFIREEDVLAKEVCDAVS